MLGIDRGTDAKVDGALEGASSRTRPADHIRRIAGNPRRSIAVLASSMLLGSAGMALAAAGGSLSAGSEPQNWGGLAKAGPVNPENGFPDWYEDKAGVALEGCIDARDVYCNAPPVPDPAAAPDLAKNFPDEFFYMLANAELTAAGGNDVMAEYAIEGAFAGGPVVDGDQMVFGRTRYRFRGGLNSNVTYKITNPYGVDYVKPDPGATDLFVTEDIGTAAGRFDGVFKSQVGPFLTWNPAQAPAAPAGYIGDPDTPHTVTGSPFDTNFVKIEGTGVGGPNNPNPCPGLTPATSPNCIYTDQFSLTGKLSTRGGVQVARATYSKASADADAYIAAMAGSKSGQTIVLEDAGGAFPATKLAGDAGRYFGHVKVPAGKTLPAEVTLTNAQDVPKSVKTVKLVDQVTGTARYDTATGEMTVTATSSDATARPTLAGEGALEPVSTAPGTATYSYKPANGVPTDTVAVDGARGHADLPVEITGATESSPVELWANAGPDVSVRSGASVTLDGSSSTGRDIRYSWSQTAPATPQVTLQRDGAKATFTAPNNATADAIAYTFQLEVSGTGAAAGAAATTATDTVTITVQPNPDGAATTDALTVDKARWIGDTGRWTVSGTAALISDNVIHVFSGRTELATSAVEPDGTWAVDVRDSTVQPVPCATGTGFCVRVRSDRGAEITVPLDRVDGTPAAAPAAAAAPQPAAAGTTAAAAAPGAPARVVPLAGAVTAPRLAASSVAVAPTLSGASIASAGLPLTVNVPRGITLLQVRILAGAGKPVYKGFQRVKSGSRARIKIRSAKLRALKSGRRYTLEVRAGTSRASLGRPVVKKFRVKR